MTDFRCRHDFIVAMPGDKPKEKKGILLPDGADLGDAPVAEVVAVGPLVQDIEVGDTVLIPLMTQMRMMQTKTCDLLIDDKPAVVLRCEDVAVVWPKEVE